jgi:hypothetical protein
MNRKLHMSSEVQQHRQKIIENMTQIDKNCNEDGDLQRNSKKQMLYFT